MARHRALVRPASAPTRRSGAVRRSRLVAGPASAPTLAGPALAKALVLALVFVAAATAGTVGASEDATEFVLDEIVVAERLITPTRQAAETVYTGLAVTGKGIEVGGRRAATSVAGAIDLLPGISVGRPDDTGLAIEQGSVRLRGVPGSLGTLTVEGVPNYGGNPIGPRDYLYDLDNFESVAVYLGATPADVGTGVGTRGGAIVLRPKWPGAEPEARLTQAGGSHGYARTYLRLASGAFGQADTAIAAAVSYSEADKWRGPGDLGPRVNANLALVQPLGERVEVKLWFNHNDQRQHLYRPLDFAEARRLNQTYKRDFNDTLTGRPAIDINYYDYNRGEYRNNDLLAVLDWQPTDRLSVTFKPYYSAEDSQILNGVTAGGGRVQARNRDIERYGVIAEVALTFGETTGLLGIHYESSDMDISTQNYGITGGGLQWRGAGVTATTGTTEITSPYLTLAGNQGRLNWQGGLKYFRFADSASEGFTSGPAPDFALLRATDLDRQARTHDIWLPTLGFGWSFTPALEAYTSAGRNFIRPYSYLPLVNLYSTNRAAFRRAGVTLDELFQGYGMEESDNLDLGLRWRTERLEVLPTLWWSQHRNLLTTVSDARVLVAGRPVSYRQNVAESAGYGLDLSMNLFPTEQLTLFVNPSWTRLTYDEDLTFQGVRRDTKGNQVLDTPEWLMRAGLIWAWRGFEVQPTLRYVGGRFGDAEHRESVSGYLTADLKLAYETRIGGRRVRAGIELDNLFDERYIAAISASDDNRAGATGYYPGAPFSAMLTLGIDL